ncbi:hypothetical protein C7974DRAFT_377197 [Boeremia exigua]|uniref:uncharacterized protein n=1 Tax=Boeremia exigua TaxID=749465 RepID=UPI001E8D822B|nr:uncharacterized protein C7974DRAFT_377197 [Boeremia exigua]KAH6625726.1 hypothetical protein C7974DRAFT_377197 [Boeremia exigua]
MRPSILVIALAASVSAIHIRLHAAADCTGAYLECDNVDPIVCCTDSSDWWLAARFFAIPRGWTLRTEVFTGRDCGKLLESWTATNNRDKCMGGMATQGSAVQAGLYHFASVKGAVDEQSPAETGCTPQKPNVLALEDGQRYNISGMNDSQLQPLLKLAVGGAAIDGIPAIYGSFVI